MLSKKIDNERKACDAVARALEDRTNVKRSNAHSPEDDKADAPVEYVFELDGQAYAFEHTIVEAFEGQIRTDVDFRSFVTPIVEALDHSMPPPGRFILSFGIHPSKGMNRKDAEKVQAAIIKWVRTSAVDLHAQHPDPPERGSGRRAHEGLQKDIINGIEVHLVRETFWEMPHKARGRLFVARFAPKNYDDLRLARLKKAVDAKLPKLKHWKIDGARSILILENRDLALSNPGVIHDALVDALRGYRDSPDEVWLVDTTIDDEWTVWCLLRDGVSFPDDETAVRFRDFNPNELTEV